MDRASQYIVAIWVTTTAANNGGEFGSDKEAADKYAETLRAKGLKVDVVYTKSWCGTKQLS